MKHGKHYVDAAKLVDSTKLYEVNEALELACKTASAKFDETVELHVRLGVDGRHADQQVRGAVVLPNGTGKTVRVCAIAKGAAAAAAEAAGADIVGDDELIAKIAALNPEDGTVDEAALKEYKEKFLQQMGNDLNTSMGVTALYDALKAKTNDATKLAILDSYDQVLSLSLLEKAAAMREANAKAQTAKAEGGYTVTGEGDPAIDALVMQRYEAKKSKNFAEADRIRDELKAQGIEIVDAKDGASWKRV